MDRSRAIVVTFRHPFTIGDMATLLPPGDYVIEIDEEQIPGLSFVAYRRVRTTIALPLTTGPMAGRQVTDIAAGDLEAALASDGQAAHGGQ